MNEYGEPTFSQFEVELVAAVQCLYIVRRWNDGHITTEQARLELLDWDDPEHKHEPGRLEFWAESEGAQDDG